MSEVKEIIDYSITDKILSALGDSFKFDDFRDKLNELNYPAINREQTEKALSSLFTNYMPYFVGVDSSVSKELPEVEMTEFLAYLENHFDPNPIHSVVSNSNCSVNYNLIRKTLLNKLEKELIRSLRQPVNKNKDQNLRNFKMSTALDLNSQVLFTLLQIQNKVINKEVPKGEIAKTAQVLFGYSSDNFWNHLGESKRSKVNTEITRGRVRGVLKKMLADLDREEDCLTQLS